MIDHNAETGTVIVDYSGFGVRGSEFQALFDDTWNHAERLWDEHPQTIELEGMRVIRPPMTDALDLLDRSQFLFSVLRGAGAILNTFTAAQCSALWTALAPRFAPSLRSEMDLISSKRDLILLHTLIKDVYIPAGAGKSLLDRRFALNGASHGPFAAHEMAYLLSKYPRLIEVGCGSGYFAYEFFRRGGDIIAQDNNKYGMSAGDEQWTRRLSKAGRLVITDDPVSFVTANWGRALLVSWPEPGAAWLPDVMETHAAVGGKVLILKIGGYVGSGFKVQHPGYRPPDNIQHSFQRFFRLLQKDWEQVPDHPDWIPKMFYNNMFVFRRRPT